MRRDQGRLGGELTDMYKPFQLHGALIPAEDTLILAYAFPLTILPTLAVKRWLLIRIESVHLCKSFPGFNDKTLLKKLKVFIALFLWLLIKYKGMKLSWFESDD